MYGLVHLVSGRKRAITKHESWRGRSEAIYREKAGESKEIDYTMSYMHYHAKDETSIGACESK